MPEDDIHDADEERRALVEMRPPQMALLAAACVGLILVVAAAGGASLTPDDGFYATMAQILTTALVVLALDRRFLVPPVNVQSRVAVVMVGHAGRLSALTTVILPAVAIASVCGILSLDHPPGLAASATRSSASRHWHR